MATESPLAFGTYDVLAPLGEGGRVFKVAHRVLGGTFALHRLPGQTDAARFAASARAVAQVDHPHVARVHDADVADGVPFVVTDYVEGEDVGRRVATAGPTAIGEAVRLGREVADALADVHERGLVHGRLRPASVVRREADGAFVLVDVGRASAAGPDEDPRASTQADQVGVGSLLFLALTGRAASDVGGPDGPPRASDLRDDVPGWLDVLVARCLTGRPRGRYRSLEDVERALRNAPPAPDPPRVSQDQDLGPLPSEPPPVAPAPVADGSPRPPEGAPRGADLADGRRRLGGHDVPRLAPPKTEGASNGLSLVRDDPPSGADGQPAPLPADPPRAQPPPPRPPPGDVPRRRPARPAAPDERAGRRLPPAALGALLLGLVALAVFAATRGGGDDDAPARDSEREAAREVGEGGAASPAAGPAAPSAEPPARPDAAAPPAPPPASEPTGDLQLADPDRARAVADAYLQAGNDGDSAAIAGLYAARVRYYDRGPVPRDEVLADKAAYLRRWPERQYERASDVVVEPGPGGGATIRFDYTFQVGGAGRTARGEGWAELTVRPDAEGFLIIGEDGGVTRRGPPGRPEAGAPRP